MARPTTPIEVWAEEDYTLPNTQGPNKERPIDDLWAKGYDFGQTPDVETWNYLWNMQTAWLAYIENEEIPNLPNVYLQRANNLSDLRDVAVARTNLAVYSKLETDNRYLKLTGGVLTGPVKFTAGGTALDTTPGLKIGWNDSNSAREANFVNNQGPGSGGFIFRNVTDNNGAETGRVTIRQDGSLVTTGALTVAKLATVNTLSVTANDAKVAGKNIVRSVNGANADESGNVSITVATTSAAKTAAGWWKDSTTGMIFQWTTGPYKLYAQEGFDTVNFPIAFPTACLSVNTGTQYSSENIQTDCWGAVASFDRTSARIQMQWSGTDWNTSARCTIFAIGY